ncbi:MAG: DUF4248 domain-containing protein [Bacteroidaceae bacterium]|nr:DUF4248 domain-containing protein [Bacteroidaceae bacterium]
MKNNPFPAVIDSDSALATIVAAQEERRLNSVTSFCDIACRIFPPKDTLNAARNSMSRLRHFISSDPEILARLTRAGYRTRLPYLTSRQVRILAEYV